MIHLDNVCFQYETSAEDRIHHLSLSIEQGEYVAMSGPNGSGKSTLAKLMGGLLLPRSGDVYVGGWNTQDEQERWNIRSKVGLIFQNPDNQMVATTVEDDVAFGLENLGVPRKQMMERIEQALKKVYMWEQRFKEPQHLSGGQKQRTAIAGILAMKPEVMIFDEATSMLDPAGRREILRMMHTLHEEGFTIVHITHDMEEALHASRLLVLQEGQIVQDGKAETLLAEQEMLAKHRLTPPFVVQATDMLRKYGLPLPTRVMNERELAEELWTFASAT